jgi:biopolymer transport protein ExbB/TolQ
MAIFAGPLLIMYPTIDNFAVFGVAGAAAIWAAMQATRPGRATTWLVVSGAAVGLATREQSAEEIAQAMEEAARDEQPVVEHHVRWLATLAQVSTLLGLLGTVTGMVRAFQVIQHKATSGNPVSPGDLAGGIWEALITTVAGLEVAIPTILAYHYLLSRIVEVQFQMEKVARLVSGWRHHLSD